jgi:hypothetical protein
MAQDKRIIDGLEKDTSLVNIAGEQKEQDQVQDSLNDASIHESPRVEGSKSIKSKDN